MQKEQLEKQQGFTTCAEEYRPNPEKQSHMGHILSLWASTITVTARPSALFQGHCQKSFFWQVAFFSPFLPSSFLSASISTTLATVPLLLSWNCLWLTLFPSTWAQRGNNEAQSFPISNDRKNLWCFTSCSFNILIATRKQHTFVMSQRVPIPHPRFFWQWTKPCWLRPLKPPYCVSPHTLGFIRRL